MNTINHTPLEAVATEAKSETAITSAGTAASAASATSAPTPASTPAPAVVPARFPAPVRATSGEPWPGQREWNDHDYRQFVELMSQGAFPEVENDSCVWDDFFVRDRESDTPFRPTLISPDDYRDHLTYYREYYGILAWKLWDVAQSKGFTAAYEEEMRREKEELDRQEEEASKVDVRKEVDTVKRALPAEKPKSPADPHQQWYNDIMADVPPHYDNDAKAKHLQEKVIEGQPFRHALAHGDADSLANATYGPLMLNDSDNAEEPQPDYPEVDSPEDHWSPNASARNIVNGIARDLSAVVSTLVARQKVSIGFKSDRETIREVCRLTRSLRELNQVVRETQRQKSGPKPKRRLPKTT